MQWRIPERNKGLVLCADLAAGMMYIMLCRDLNEVPGGDHDWLMACHGWGIFFLQAKPSIPCTTLCRFNSWAHVRWVFIPVMAAAELAASGVIKVRR